MKSRFSLLGILAIAACSPSQPTPPSAASHTSAAPPAAGSASATPLDPPPAGAASRRHYAIDVALDDTRQVSVSLELPASWGSSVENGRVKLRTCRLPRHPLDRVEVSAIRCPMDKSGRACLDHVVSAKAPDRHEPRGALGEWVTTTSKGPGAASSTTRELLLVAEQGTELVSCTVTLSDADVGWMEPFTKMCETLSLESDSKPDSGNVAPRPSADDRKKPEDGPDKLAADVATRMIEALARRDFDAAAELVPPSAADCKKAPLKARARCSADRAKIRAGLPRFAESIPRDFKVRAAEVHHSTLESSPPLAVWVVDLWSESALCAEPKSLTVASMGGEMRVLIALRAD